MRLCEGKAIRPGLRTRIHLLIYTSIAAMLLVFVPAVEAYLGLREAFPKACRELDRQLQERRLETPAAHRTTATLEADAVAHRLAALAARWPAAPFADLEAAEQLGVRALEATAAATFVERCERLIGEARRFLESPGERRDLDLARVRAEEARELWGARRSAAAAGDLRLAVPHRELEERYSELARLAGRLADSTGGDRPRELRELYAAQLGGVSASLRPLADALLGEYQTRLAARARPVSRRIDLGGHLLALAALLVLVPALAGPWLTARWISPASRDDAGAARKPETGNPSGRIEAGGAHPVVVDLGEAESQLGRRERLVVLGQLAGSVAHEIRNPLGVMKNSVYYLRLTQKLKDEKAIQHLGLIEDEISRADRIITELLDYARDPTSRIGRFVLQDAFYKALAQVGVPESVHVEDELAEQPLTVMGDGGQVERILANLLRNAVQAMPDGGVLVIACRRHGEELVAEIRDTGVGIAEEDLARIFEPLFTGKAKGIGLGLPLSQRYAYLNGGRIECESELGRGATFRLVLPVLQEEKADD